MCLADNSTTLGHWEISLIKDRFGINFNLKISKKGSGQIIIPFKSKVEFDEIIKKINNE